MATPHKPLSYFDCVANVKTRQGSNSSLDYWDKTCRKVRRFYQRFYTGIGVGGRIRLLTLTTSDEALKQGLNIHRSYSILVKRLRRLWGRFEYIWVNEDKDGREHLHIVFRGEYMKQALISKMWDEIHKSPIVDIRQVRGVKDSARYLAKYLAKGNHYHASYNWVFPGWVKWSQTIKRLVGYYPSKSIIRVLAQLEQHKREEAMCFLMVNALVWSKRYIY